MKPLPRESDAIAEPEPRIFVAAACPACEGWAAMHFAEGVGGMWHDHDGTRVEFVRVELVGKLVARDMPSEDRAEAFRAGVAAGFARRHREFCALSVGFMALTAGFAIDTLHWVGVL